MKEIHRPERIKKGDKIAVISPAGAVEASHLQAGLEMLQQRGYEYILGKNVYAKYHNGYTYAGTESERSEDLNWALNDPEIAAVWVTRGGYGCQHLLDKISLKGFKKRPKWFIGYSDNTVLQSFLLKQNFASIHGQSIKTATFGVTEKSYSQIFSILEGNRTTYTLESHGFNRNGHAKGILVGGNLAMIYALLGTSYGFNFKNKILFIEEIGEQYYALDRMLMSLKHTGAFSKIKGLIVGGMTNMGDKDANKSYKDSYDQLAYKIIAERTAGEKFPVIFGFPNGHIRNNQPLIIGAETKILVERDSIISF